MKLSQKVGCAVLVLIALLSLSCSAMAVVKTLHFEDAKDHWAEEIIEALAEKEVVKGYDDGKCHPDELVTRGQFSALLARYFNYKATGDISGFSDVKGHWAEDAISGLVGAGIVSVKEYEGIYKPDDHMTRIEMVYMIDRALGFEDVAKADKSCTAFTDDASISPIHKGYLNVAHALGIVNGFGDGSAQPYALASRAEAFVMFYRMLDVKDMLGSIRSGDTQLTPQQQYEKLLEQIKEAEEAGKQPEAPKPEEPKPTTPSSGGGGGGGSYVPAPRISFELPETAYVGVKIPVTATSSNAKTVTWTLSKDGAAVQMEDGALNEAGGTLSFDEVGTYTLKAVAANSRGRTETCEKTITVYPVMGIAFVLPSTAHTDTAIPVEVITENTGDAAITWDIKRNDAQVTLSEVAEGFLDNASGMLQFKEVGTYTVTASVVDELGTVTTCEQTVQVYPVASIYLTLPDTTHVDETATVSVSGENLTGLTVEWGAAKDGEEIAIAEHIGGELNNEGGTLSFTEAGTYAVTATVTDLTGRSWSDTKSIISYPVGMVEFSMPDAFHTDSTVTVEASTENLADNTLVWTLQRNGAEVDLADYISGALTADGGSICIDQTGSYTLTASFTDQGNRSYSHEQSFTVYPVMAIEFTLPSTAHTDTAIPVEVITENIGDTPITWDIKRDDVPMTLSDAISGNPDNGLVQFKEAGSYTVTASVVDEIGRVTKYEQTVQVYPVASISLTLSDKTHVDETATVSVSGENLTGLTVAWSAAKDGEEIVIADCISGELSDNGGIVGFTEAGTYAVTATVTDDTGRSWSDTKWITSYPVGEVGFFLPTAFHTDDTVTVEASIDNLAEHTLVWTLQRNGAEVDLVDYISGTLSATGGDIQVLQEGDYTLTASFTDSGNRSYSYAQSFTVYPVMNISFELPSIAHTDTEIPVELTAENVGDTEIVWSIKQGDMQVALDDLTKAQMDRAGGLLQFKEAGIYTVIASVTDEIGRVVTYEQTVQIYPVASISLGLPDITHTDYAADVSVSGKHLSGLSVEWSVAKNDEDIIIAKHIDGDLSDEGGTLTFKEAGIYAITAKVTDATGRSWSDTKNITSYPVGEVDFSLPDAFHIDETVTVRTRIDNLAGNALVWTLQRNGAEVDLVDYISGTLNADGGNICIDQTGSYILTASFTDDGNRTYSHEQSFTVYPVMGVSFTLPSAAHTDTAIPVELTTENAGDVSITWRIEQDGVKATLSKVANGYLDSAGGLLQFKEAGTYTVSASVTDTTGRVSTCEQTVQIYPVASISLTLPSTTHVDEAAAVSASGENLTGLTVEWSATKNGEDIIIADRIDGELSNEGGTLGFIEAGTYAITVKATDAAGRSWSDTKRITSYPVGEVGFFLPTEFHTDDTVTVEASIGNLADNTLVWTLQRNGREVALADYISGTLTANGGSIRVMEKGSYTLTASFVDGGGRSYSYEQSFTVYPVPNVRFSLSATAWTDTVLTVNPTVTDTEDVTIEWMVDNTYGYQDWDTYVDGSLSNNGGSIRFKRAGSYELVARITDAIGRVFLYEQGACCEVQPVLKLDFTLPSLVPQGCEIEVRTSGNNNVLPVTWTLKKNSTSVPLSNCVIGTLNAYGGRISFTDYGEFELIATIEDVLGRTFTHSERIQTLPLATYVVNLPDSAHLGESFSVTGTGEHLESCTATWSLKKDGTAVTLRDYISETLSINGGRASIRTPGTYELTCVIEDPYGNKTTASDSIVITNTAPNAPSITAAVDYSDIRNPYTTDYQAKVNVSVTASDPDGDTVSYEYASDSANTGYYGAGTYTVKVRAKDQWGSYSEWATKQFTIDAAAAGAPTVSLTSSTLGSSAITSSKTVKFNAEVHSGSKYQLSYLDYYTGSGVTTKNDIAASTVNTDLSGSYANGRHLMVVQVKDIFGNTAYASKFFAVGSSVGGDSANITSLSTTVREEGVYDGSTPLAYIDSFTFNIPAVSGHSTNCTDVVTISGVKADGTQVTLVSFNTNDGYTYVSSDGTYKYTTSGSSQHSGTWSTWKTGTYTKLIFHYQMASGHEDCIARATGGVYYTVNYQFIESSTDNLEKLFQ